VNRIVALDPLLMQIAKALVESPKQKDWQSVLVRTRITPDGTTASPSFQLEDLAGQTVAGWFPPDSKLDQIYELARECRRVSAERGARLWYGMTLRVWSDGRFETDFEFRDHYREGDISREP
jgi:hypothetical protein